MIVDASRGFYLLTTDPASTATTATTPVDGLHVTAHEDRVVVGTVGSSDDGRVSVTFDYWDQRWGESAAGRLDRWPGEVWRAHVARTEVTASDVLTLTTASGKVMELTPGPGRFGVAVFARTMAPGEWPAQEPQEHHILVVWPLVPGIAPPSDGLPRERRTRRPGELRAAALDSVLSLFEHGITPVIRTHFSDDAAWDRLVALLTEPRPVGGGAEYVPHVRPVDQAAFEGLDADGLARAYDESRVGYVLLADAVAMTGEADPGVLYVDLYDRPGQAFRCASSAVAAVEANLATANLDFGDFAESVDEDGVYRG